jgi:ornithine carbamoyltransferase
VNALDSLSPERSTALVATARALQCAAAAGAPPRPLRGRRFGLLAGAADSASAARFRRAAMELGAQVTDIAPDFDAGAGPSQLARTARVLGKLYDAIACEGLEPAFAGRLADSAPVPVYRDVASERHPTAGLAGALGALRGGEAQRRFVLQAVLLEAAL